MVRYSQRIPKDSKVLRLMESLGKPIVNEIDYVHEAWRLNNMEVFLGQRACRIAGLSVNDYIHSVNVQLELPYPDRWERLLSE